MRRLDLVRRYFGDAAELTELESKKVKNVDVSVSSCPVCMQAGRCSKKYYNLNGNTKPVLKLRRHYKISWRSSLSQGTRIAKRSQPSRIGLLAWPDAEERERRYVMYTCVLADACVSWAPTVESSSASFFDSGGRAGVFGRRKRKPRPLILWPREVRWTQPLHPRRLLVDLGHRHECCGSDLVIASSPST